MTATGSDPPDAAAAGGEDIEGSEGHAYFRAVEDVFIRLRGAPFLLSPSDWRVADGWRRAGVPLELVERVLQRVLGEREEAESGKTKRIRGLRYFDSAVAAEWKSRRSLAGSSQARRAAPLDAGRRLAALAAALPEATPRRQQLGERILALAGDIEKVEEDLALLDREMLRHARRDLSAEQAASLKARVAAGLARVGDRLSPPEAKEARQRLERQIVRRMLDLPLLSLFSPQARDEADAG